MAAVLWMVAATILILRRATSTHGAPQVPAMFVFGDSLSDPGNNNDLLTLAKANYYPYGIDFAAGVTGRYCNGGTVADHLGNLMGLPLIPPFNNPNTSGSIILHGVNYASAASGILDETGTLYGDVFSMNEQMQNFRSTVKELRSLLGNEIEAFLGRSLFFIAMGANDYINNYLLPMSIKPRMYSPQVYAAVLMHEFRRQLKELFVLGARKFLLAGLPPLGCIPNQVGNSNISTEGCIVSTNILASEFNFQLERMVHELNLELPGSSFLYWDTYNFLYSIINQHSLFGFKYVTMACCGGGRSKGQIMCLPLLPFQCQNRSEYMFWDPYHPTDAMNVISAENAYRGILQANFLMNVEQLIRS